MSPSPSVTSPFVSTAARICPSSWHRNSSKRRPPSLGGTAYPCVSSNRCAVPWRVRPIRYPWKSALVNRHLNLAGGPGLVREPLAHGLLPVGRLGRQEGIFMLLL